MKWRNKNFNQWSSVSLLSLSWPCPLGRRRLCLVAARPLSIRHDTRRSGRWVRQFWLFGSWLTEVWLVFFFFRDCSVLPRKNLLTMNSPWRECLRYGMTICSRTTVDDLNVLSYRKLALSTSRLLNKFYCFLLTARKEQLHVLEGDQQGDWREFPSVRIFFRINQCYWVI